MKKIRRSAGILVLAVMLMTSLPLQVFAAGDIDLTETVSFTISNTYDGNPLEEVVFDIYLVSTIDRYGELTPTDEFAKFAEILDIRGENDEVWIATAAFLEQEILRNPIAPTDSAVTNKEGKASFPSSIDVLPMGLYLIMGTSKTEGAYVYKTAPFFVVLPAQDEVENVWLYDLAVKSKPQKTPLLTSYKVIKIWDDECHNDLPDSVTVQLLCDGEAYGEPVTLPHNGAWSYTWTDLEADHSYWIEEFEVEGYDAGEPVLEGNTFVITNTCNRTPPPEGGNPQTGQLWWPVPALAAAGLLCMVIGLLRRRSST